VTSPTYPVPTIVSCMRATVPSRKRGDPTGAGCGGRGAKR